ncbi:MAG: amidohydrolase [Rhodospirillaceae bacterium]|jgi:amidohydrolase|nr:amidohydrolase [Rhodospirillaceae bacterium]MBT5941075.1 amidohydrolase [Rhodospirillaceae bacterium]MBT7268852.1 amidohydrolase [Rhodospirillaceae bacterium]
MPIVKEIQGFHEEMVAWRHELHAYPETAFEEVRTADFVAKKLAEFGIEVSRGLAKTGVVGTLSNGSGGSIGLRADMDALDIEEQTDLPFSSKVKGKMHACGHDGHTTMLLGAAKYLAKTKRFNGTVQFIFQPAEEMAGGGGVMVREGLFDQFPVQSVYGMHNWPNMAAGMISIRPGPGMASAALFEIVVTGVGCHAAAPHQGIDPIVAGSAIVEALQTISSRTTNPNESVVVSVTQFHAGDADNVIPDQAVLRGTARSFAVDSEKILEPLIKRVAEGVAAAHGATIELHYDHRYPVLVNEEKSCEIALKIAEDVVGAEAIDVAYPPTMASEDFAFMLNEVPGCFIRLGTAIEGEISHPLHNAHYKFNDDVLPIGASFWSQLVESELKEA